MKPKCPYCGKYMDKDIALPPMSARKLRVYQTVAAAGDKGIMSKDLLVRMYDDEEFPTPGGDTVLRVQICELNKILADYNQHIIGRRTAGYRLTSIKGDKIGKTVKKDEAKGSHQSGQKDSHSQ